MKLRPLLCLVRPHTWHDIYILPMREQHPTPVRQKCDRCGLSREVQSTLVPGTLTRNYWWVYSNGRREPDERIYKHA